MLAGKTNNHFATVEASEPGSAVRDKVFKNTIQSGMYKSPSKLTIDKFWNGEKVSGVSYTGATEEFKIIATDLDPNLSAQFETTRLNYQVILPNRKED
ncbi:hypothetical protein [Spiroplasma taiwanense]|uniref:Uncharacterized protein n=1 Tax=Spiroplasma taiwanense CT-1 TaxID=1276220 RepID=S5LU95_9MOLU|nr:hypothetical protein [Spiroplasma taiwanense]AGR41334.1 hypothetical protein STAIW_v1c07220 [Spiroplasma taiwanense CT-1]